MTPEERLKKASDLLNRVKLIKEGVSDLPISAAEFCRRHKKLINYEANLSRVMNNQISPKEKTILVLEAALKKEYGAWPRL